VVGHLEDFRLQVDLAAIVGGGQRPRGLVVQVAGEQEVEAPVSQPEDDRVAVDGVRGRLAGEAGRVEVERLVADAGSLRRVAQELQARDGADRGGDRPEDLHRDPFVLQEFEGAIVPGLQTLEGDGASRDLESGIGKRQNWALIFAPVDV
jgi:hypothetical protein